MSKFKKTVDMKYAQWGHKGIGRKIVVSGIGKRSIIVVIRPFLRHGVDEEKVAWHAAEYASKRGWRVVYVIPGYADADYLAYVVNSAGFHQPDEHQYSRFLMDVDWEGTDEFSAWRQGLPR